MSRAQTLKTTVPKFRLYELGLLNEYDIDYYLVAANLSDIAMGAYALGALSVVRYPSGMTDDVFASVLMGISPRSPLSGGPFR